jgi:hypothetical protein
MDFIHIEKQMVQYRKLSKAYERSRIRDNLEISFMPPIEVESFEGSPVTYKNCHGVAYLHALNV